MTFSPSRSPQGELLARLRSGSRLLGLERRLSVMAHADSLTGLLNQRTFYAGMAKEWHRSKRLHLPLSCVMMDLDFFKRVNDVYGHPAGDSVLRCVAELLLDNSRGSDTVGRYGGEEFCVMLPETNENDAAAWAERARQRLASLRLPFGGGELRLTGSFGIAQCRDDTQNSEQLVNLADEALLCAKRMGRDRVVRYSLLADGAELVVQSAGRYDRVFLGVFARDVMDPLAICLRDDEPIRGAVEFFIQCGIPSTPVLGADGRLVGFLSEKDLMTALVAGDCWERPIQKVMSANAICYDEGTPIRAIYEFLCRVSIHGVVITRGGRPVGTITRGMLLRWFCRQAAGLPQENAWPGQAALAGAQPGAGPCQVHGRGAGDLSP